MSVLGKIASADIAAADTAQLLAQVDGDAIVNILCCNRNSADITIRMAIGPSTGSSPAAADWIEYDVLVAANQPMERTGLAVSKNEKLWVQASSLNVSFRAHGVPAT
ncbi:hypothetical protein [Aquabacterium sp.]|uniref:hypothetical protein n=1 Tax=Aquabacterium sp. TaxID=1872578 RepID=UPI0025C45F84|nr:hypothetical protein [Aquabacterium sp.]